MKSLVVEISTFWKKDVAAAEEELKKSSNWATLAWFHDDDNESFVNKIDAAEIFADRIAAETNTLHFVRILFHEKGGQFKTVKLVHNIGYRSFVLLIDELEEVIINCK